MVAAVTIGGYNSFDSLDLGNIAFLYLVPVIVAASLFGLRAGVLASIASSLAFNFFFLSPTGTFKVANPGHLITLIILLAVAYVTSHLLARLRAQAQMAARSAEGHAALAGFLEQLAATAVTGRPGLAICAGIERVFDVRAILLELADDGRSLCVANSLDNELAAIDLAAGRWALERGLPAGRGSDTLPSSSWSFFPLKSGARARCAIGLAKDDGSDPIPFKQRTLLLSLLGQADLALERAQIEEERRDVAELRQRDSLRAALLSSVSHDLRTPLTSILAAAAALPTEMCPTLVETIRCEAERLNRFVANLLNMARVDAGALKLVIEPIDLTDAIASAICDTRVALGGRAVHLDVPTDLPLVRVDPQLFHHCLISLLDNAGRYADAATPVTMTAKLEAGSLTLSILDEGPGLPRGRESEVFEAFRRFESPCQPKAGTGLGLAIVKGFAGAMGFIVEAANRDDKRGACFCLRFPELLLLVVQCEELQHDDILA
jgi:two-component system sensor histidine kinase KdpD